MRNLSKPALFVVLFVFFGAVVYLLLGLGSSNLGSSLQGVLPDPGVGEFIETEEVTETTPPPQVTEDDLASIGEINAKERAVNSENTRTAELSSTTGASGRVYTAYDGTYFYLHSTLSNIEDPESPPLQGWLYDGENYVTVGNYILQDGVYEATSITGFDLTEFGSFVVSLEEAYNEGSPAQEDIILTGSF